MNYDDATGYLVGEAHQGMHAMFTMMNEERVAIGVEGVGVGDAACQNAANYARERRQGRAVGSKTPKNEADPIIVHPDVRRMLMTGRALTQGMRALALWTMLQDDLAKKSPDEAARQEAEDLLGLMTPVVKAFCSDRGFDVANLALQCFGGHGYIREWGMEQYVRDARIPPIYEGTNGIQALDLVTRKLPAQGGRAINLFLRLVGETVTQGRGGTLRPLADALGTALEHLALATSALAEKGMKDANELSAAAVDYLALTGLVATGWMWLRMALVAHGKLRSPEGDALFFRNKLVTASFYMEKILPEAAARRAVIEAGAETVMAMDAEAF
jgi:hypothetical protein